MAKPSAEKAVRFCDIANSMHRGLLAVAHQQSKPCHSTRLCLTYYKHSITTTLDDFSLSVTAPCVD